MKHFIEDWLLARSERIFERRTRGKSHIPRHPFRPDFAGYPYEKVYGDLKLMELAFIAAEQYELDHADSRLARLVILFRRWRVSRMSPERQLAWLKAQISWSPIRYVKPSAKREDPEPRVDVDDVPEPQGDAIEPGPAAVQTVAIERPPEVEA